jgi:hypothetical protein
MSNDRDAARGERQTPEAARMPRRWKLSVPPVVAPGAAFESTTLWPPVNSRPVVRPRFMVVCAGTHRTPVPDSPFVAAVAAVPVVLPVAVPVVVPFVPPVGGVVVPGVVGVVGVAGAGVVGAEAALGPTDAPHTAVAAVLVISTSVTTSRRPVGTVNTLTAVVPESTVRVRETTCSTVTVLVVPPIVEAGVVDVVVGVVVAGGACATTVVPVPVPTTSPVDGPVEVEVVVVVGAGDVTDGPWTVRPGDGPTSTLWAAATPAATRMTGTAIRTLL